MPAACSAVVGGWLVAHTWYSVDEDIFIGGDVLHGLRRSWRRTGAEFLTSYDIWQIWVQEHRKVEKGRMARVTWVLWEPHWREMSLNQVHNAMFD